MDNDLDKQIIFKLGAIEAEVRSIGSQLTDSIHQLSERIDKNSLNNAKNIAKLEDKVEKSEVEIQRLKDWKNTIVAKVAGAGSAVAVFWLIFGKAIETTVEKLI
jgi:hypothetical protein